MSLSREERRELAEIDQLLSQESELVTLAALFAQPRDGLDHRPGPAGACAAGARHRFARVAVSFVLAVAGVIAGCVVGSLGQPASIAAGVVLVLCSGLGMSAVLIRYANG
ncbi:MAG TPA: hypothetical protein VHF06_22795 [Pseudonocardiaceae bacterium]|jgi:hypothetical protein|nr:hypothetical protein [Pseudonocardiaceae bacterium]